MPPATAGATDALVLPTLTTEQTGGCDNSVLSLLTFGGVAASVPPHGPALCLADVTPGHCEMIFVATERAILGFTLQAVLSSPKLCHVTPNIEVPTSGRILRLRCGLLNGQHAVAAADGQGVVTVFLSDPQARIHGNVRFGAPPVQRLKCPGPSPVNSVAFVSAASDRGDVLGYIYAGNAVGQVFCWQLHAEMNNGLVAGPACEMGTFRCHAPVADIDVDIVAGVLAAGLDGRLELWPAVDEHKPLVAPRLLAQSESTARRDCAETATLWGARWLPLHSVSWPCWEQQSAGVMNNRDSCSITGVSMGAAAMRCEDKVLATTSQATGSVLSSQLVCRVLLPLLPLSTLACGVATVSRLFRAIVEHELSSPSRQERLVMCFSDCTAWLLDGSLRLLARQDLPFCAAHSHAVVVPGLSAVLIAPKTDLVVASSGAIAVMPHVWALTVWRRRGFWRPHLHVKRLDLRPSSAMVAAGADMGKATAAWSNRMGQRREPRPVLIPKDPSYVLGVAAHNGNLWAFLANGEVLAHRIGMHGVVAGNAHVTDMKKADGGGNKSAKAHGGLPASLPADILAELKDTVMKLCASNKALWKVLEGSFESKH